MNKLGKWESEHYYLNYVWQTKDRTQQIALAPIPINKQGKFSVSHDVRASFETLCYLPDHFFVEAIAKQEIENWAKVINDFIRSKNIAGMRYFMI